MNLIKKLGSKNFFVFNLVLIGVIFGFSLAFLSFSCSTPGQNTVQAEESPVVIPQDSMAVAETLQTVFRGISSKVLPSIVELKVVEVRKQQVPQFNGIPWEFFFGPQGGQGEGNGDTEEREYRSQGLGSGVIVRKTGDLYYVLTNNHVVGEATEIYAVTNSGKEYEATLVGKDARTDLALVSFKTSDFYPQAILGDSDAVQVGDFAFAFGTPLGFMSTVTMGIVSAVGRTGGPAGNINDFIQTDASINQGNSGGALVNIRGEVIGINTWIASNSQGAGSVGLGFAIPINNTKRSIDEFINSGSIQYGWLGVSLQDSDKDTAEILGITGKKGALASQVFIGSPAEKAGIVPGDFITHVNGKEASGSSQLSMMIGDVRVGETAKLNVIRDKKPMEVSVKIEERKDEVAADNSKLWPGLYAIALTEDVKSSLDLDDSAVGIYVGSVLDKTPADIIGVRRGDIIVGINGTSINDLAEFYTVLRENTSRELWFELKRGDAEIETVKFKR
ncbi:MAG: Do family serine endopeptidase [Treponema sp.]|jgi:Do/DeqQ family serine protease|nr:Do family serine endopeptidase [Treponema sp.]